LGAIGSSGPAGQIGSQGASGPQGLTGPNGAAGGSGSIGKTTRNNYILAKINIYHQRIIFLSIIFVANLTY